MLAQRSICKTDRIHGLTRPNYAELLPGSSSFNAWATDVEIRLSADVELAVTDPRLDCAHF